MVHFLRKKFFFKKIKKIPSRPFLTHPAAGPETEVFLVWPNDGFFVTGPQQHIVRLGDFH